MGCRPSKCSRRIAARRSSHAEEEAFGQSGEEVNTIIASEVPKDYPVSPNHGKSSMLMVRETGSGKLRVGQKTKPVSGPLGPQLSNSYHIRKPQSTEGSPPTPRALFRPSRHRNRLRFTRQRTPSQVEFFKQLEEKINQGADLED